MKNKHLLYEAMQLSNNNDVERLIKCFLLSNELQTTDKFNPYDFTSKKDMYRPALAGVHYEDGYVYASDGYSAIKVRQEYDSKLEGKVIGKDGVEISGNFPDINRVFPSIENLSFINIDFNRILAVAKEFRIDRKANKSLEFAVIRIGKVYLDVELLVKIAKFAIHFNIDKMGVQQPDKCVMVTDENNSALLMPVIYKDQKVYEL